MERKLWKQMYKVIHQLGKTHKTPGMTYKDFEIVMIYLWAVLHDRPTEWACHKMNWDRSYRPQNFPHPVTMSRRLKHAGVQRFLVALEEHLKDQKEMTFIHIVDGKPLGVSRYTKDPDAAWGHGAGGFQKGYKIHVIWGTQAFPEAWDVAPMNVDEPTKARELLPQMVQPQGYLLGDGLYDVNKLFAAAAAQELQLITPRKFPHKGIGKRARHSARLRNIELIATRFGQDLLDWRSTIERSLGQLTNISFGLKGLPNWVRRITRVKRWVQAKLICFGFYRLEISL